MHRRTNRAAPPDVASSFGTSVSSALLPSPRHFDELASSIDTDRTILIVDRPLTRPPSPAALVYVSLSVPLPTSAELRERGAMVPQRSRPTRESAGAASPPSAPAAYCAATSLVSEGQRLSSADRYSRSTAELCGLSRERVDDGDNDYSPSGCVRSSTYLELASNEAEQEEDDDAMEFGSTVNSATSNTDSTPSAALTEAWAVVWQQLFPAHISVFLCARDVAEVSRVCRLTNEAAQQPWVWRSMAALHFNVRPAQLERTFAGAVRQWEAEAEEDEERSTALRCSPRFRVREAPALFAHPSSGDHAPPADSNAESMATFTPVTPWHVLESGETVDFEDVVATSDEDEFESTQIPHFQLGGGLEEELVERLAQAATSAAGSRLTLEAAAAAIASNDRVATRVALAQGSRYLWQTAAAAMPSPSSPQQNDEDGDEEAVEEEGVNGEEEEDGPAALAATATYAPTAAAQSHRRMAAIITAAPERSSAGGSANPSPAMSTAGFVEWQERPMTCASPRPRDAVSHMSSSSVTATAAVGEEAPCTVAAASSSTGAAAAAAERSGLGEKCRGVRRSATHEQLPPPTPAQLDDTTGEEVTEGDGSLWASFSAGQTARRYPSYVLEMATDVTVSNADAGASIAVSPSSPHLNGIGDEQNSPPSPPAGPAVYCFTLCRATAERTVLRRTPAFPWRLFTQYLHTHRVRTSLAEAAELSRRARVELCSGAWEAAYGSLSHAVHVLFQQGSCRSVEHLVHLARTLVRRASLCRHRGHLHILAAFTDLCAASVLCPDSVSAAELAGLCEREEFVSTTPAKWLQAFNDAAHVASPVALLGSLAQVPLLFPQNRTLCFCSALTSYMRAQRTLGQSLTHLLCRASDWATPGTEEELLVSALRIVARAKRAQQRSCARAACATADYALSLMPLHVRTALEALCSTWVRDCFHSEGTIYGLAMTQWSQVAPEAVSFASSVSLEQRWLAWTACEVRCFVYEEMTGQLPTNSPLSTVVLSLTCHDRADGLVRMATHYVSSEVRTEDLVPALPRGASRRRVAQYLLHNALRLRPLHPTAAVLLSRIHACDDESAPLASAVLTDCIHRWAQRFSLLEMSMQEARRGMIIIRRPGSTSAPAYLHRRDRRPEVCFIPSELLVGRNRCLQTVADLAEATEQHPGLSYPYQMRAAMAMDRGYHLAAVLEMNRIIKMTLDVGDVALRLRFLQDALEVETQRVMALPLSERVEMTSALAMSMTELGNSVSLESAAQAQGTSPPSQQLLPVYRMWMAKMSGLLTLLRTPETGGEDDSLGLSCTSAAAAASFSRVLPRELLSMSSVEYGAGHVSRVASMAFSEGGGEGDGSRFFGGGGADASNAAHVRAFLEDLVSISSVK